MIGGAGMTVGDMVLRVRLSVLWRDLGGGELHRGRGRAFWRGGDGLSVSVNEQKRLWYDHKTKEGGGVLDLFRKVWGCSRQEAIQKLSEYTGVPLVDAPPLSTNDRALLAAKNRAIAVELPRALLWKRTALALAEETLTSLKESTFDSRKSMSVAVGSIAYWTAKSARWKQLDGEDLVIEYDDWRRRNPSFTEAMVKAGALHESAERAVVRKQVLYRGIEILERGPR
jgi:hypothetical protein